MRADEGHHRRLGQTCRRSYRAAGRRHARCPDLRAAAGGRGRCPATRAARRPSYGSADRGGPSWMRACAPRRRRREPVAEQVGQGQDAADDAERRRLAGCLELVQGIEGQDLEAVPGVQVGVGRHGRGPGRPPPGSGGRGGGSGCRRGSPRHPASRRRPPTCRSRRCAGPAPPARPAASPARISWCRRRTSQYNPSSSCTGSFGKRWTSSRASWPSATRPTITRPLEAPRSTAATAPCCTRMRPIIPQ